MELSTVLKSHGAPCHAFRAPKSHGLQAHTLPLPWTPVHSIHIMNPESYPSFVSASFRNTRLRRNPKSEAKHPKLLARCLFCADLDLCSSCFSRGAHAHHPFVRKATLDSDWAAAERPPPSVAPPQHQQLLLDLQTREITTEDYEALLRLDGGGGVPLHAHLARSLRAPLDAEVGLPSCCLMSDD